MTTQWTPELISLPLPPNVDPELVEPHYRRAGKAIRTTAMRRHEAICLDPECPYAWEGPSAFPEATAHTTQTGHYTRLYYRAEYVMQVNPLHPAMRGKVRTTVIPDAPDLPPEQQHLFAQREEFKEPLTPGRSNNRATSRAMRQEANQTALSLLAEHDTQNPTQQPRKKRKK